MYVLERVRVLVPVREREYGCVRFVTCAGAVVTEPGLVAGLDTLDFMTILTGVLATFARRSAPVPRTHSPPELYGGKCQLLDSLFLLCGICM